MSNELRKIIGLWGLMALGIGILLHDYWIDNEMLRMRIMELYKGEDEEEMATVLKKMSGTELEGLYHFLKEREKKKKLIDPDLIDLIWTIKNKYKAPVLNKLLR